MTTDVYMDYQDQVRHAFLQIVKEDIEEASQWLLDVQGDENVDNKTRIWCEDYLNDYMVQFKEWTEEELINQRNMHK